MKLSQKNTGICWVPGMLLSLFFALAANGQEKLPKVFAPYIEASRGYEAERVMVASPQEIEKYLKLVEEGAAKNPEWYAEYHETCKRGVPMPYHKNLNLTPQEYQEYLALWGKRETKVLAKVPLKVELRDGVWRILVGGTRGTAISLLRYDEKKDVFRSTNGELKRIEDVEAPAESLLGAWKGAEWRFEQESPLGKMKENLTVGKTDDGKWGYVVYRLQDISSTNRVLLDQSVVIRFPRE